MLRPTAKQRTEAWLKQVEGVDLWDDRAFHSLVNNGLEMTGMTDAAFAELVNVSRPTVTRWRQGQSVPHSGIRLTIYKILKKEVEKDILSQQGLTDDATAEGPDTFEGQAAASNRVRVAAEVIAAYVKSKRDEFAGVDLFPIVKSCEA